LPTIISFVVNSIIQSTNMKKITLFITLFITILTTAHGQTYSEKLELYDTHNYVKQVGDPYSPVLAGFASYFIPGLGQMLCDESPRGLAFLGGYVGCLALSYYGMIEMYGDALRNFNNENYNYVPSGRGAGLMVLGFVGAGVVNIWSIVDAVHVSKVNNMYYQDHFKRTSAIDLKIAPYAEPLTMNNQVTIPVGLTLKATF